MDLLSYVDADVARLLQETRYTLKEQCDSGRRNQIDPSGPVKFEDVADPQSFERARDISLGPIISAVVNVDGLRDNTENCIFH
jgi:hypothetical protein